jgi:hypothetical protein
MLRGELVLTKEMKALWHPTRAAIMQFLSSGPALRSQLTEATGAPFAEVAYHCRALHQSGCIEHAEDSCPESEDPVYQTA